MVGDPGKPSAGSDLPIRPAFRIPLFSHIEITPRSETWTT